MIEIENLSKRFGDVAALSDVTFSVPRGQIVGFLGANGAGKTTTMDILCGCLGPDTGSASINGFDVTADPLKAKQSIGYLPDEPPLHNDMRVEEFVSYAASVRGVPRGELKERVERTIERLSLGDVRKRIVGNLSKGFRQRVGLAQAIVHDPEVLILDEPTEGLDPNQIVQIRELIRGFAGQHTILLSSHILSEVENTCDKIVIIHEGRIAEQGSYDELVGRMEAKAHYSVRVSRDVERLVEELRTVSDVEQILKVDRHTNTIQLQLVGDSTPLDAVARKAVEGGFGLMEMTPHAKSLEDVFVKLTH